MNTPSPGANAGEIARVVAALVASTTAATALLHSAGVDGRYQELVRQARALHASLELELLAAPPDVALRFHALAERTGQRLEQLEMALDSTTGESPR